MKALLAGLAISMTLSASAFAALKPGAVAPDFTVKAALGGQDFDFHVTNSGTRRWLTIGDSIHVASPGLATLEHRKDLRVCAVTADSSIFPRARARNSREATRPVTSTGAP